MHLNNWTIWHYVHPKNMTKILSNISFFISRYRLSTNLSTLCATYRLLNLSIKQFVIKQHKSENVIFQVFFPMTFCLGQFRIPGFTKNSESRSRDATVYCTVVFWSVIEKVDAVCRVLARYRWLTSWECSLYGGEFTDRWPIRMAKTFGIAAKIGTTINRETATAMTALFVCYTSTNKYGISN